jgi:hypothetical protein
MNEVINKSSFSLAGRQHTSGVDEYLRRADELHEQQRRAVLDKQAAYEAKRTELTTLYARKMSDIASEGADALHKLDAAHRVEMAAENEKLETLGRMRHG